MNNSQPTVQSDTLEYENPRTEPRRAIGTLTETLRFTPEDLAANRAGQLSEAQIDRLNTAWRRSLLSSVGIVIAVGIGAILTLYAGQQGGSFVLTVIGFALTLLNAGIVGFAAQARIRLNADLRQPVSTISGIVRHTVRVSGKAATYVLDVEQPGKTTDRMFVAKAVFFAFEEDTHYRLYRTTASKTLLSAERG